jgi:lysophospholipase L1-like esterase
MTRTLLVLLALYATRCLTAAEGFQKEWDAYVAKDKISPPPQEAVLAIGSSSMRMWSTLTTDLAPLPVFNRAFGGSVTADTVAAIPLLVLPHRPRVILYYCGDNDLAKPTTSPDVAVDGFKAFVHTVRRDLPQVRFVYLSIKPSPKRTASWANAQKANAEIAAWCSKDPLLTFIDVATPLLDASGTPDPVCYGKDQLHMTPVGYARWTAVVKPVLEKVWAGANTAK